MKAWLRRLGQRRFRPWDLLLATPLGGLIGMTATILGGHAFIWSILWVAISGAAVLAYLVIEWAASRP